MVTRDATRRRASARSSGGQRLAAMGVSALVAGVALAAPTTGAAAPDTPHHGGRGRGNAEITIDVLSNRADLISGGDVLVEVVLPDGTDPDLVRVDVDGTDVSDTFAVRDDGRFLGLVEDLAEGGNTLTADIRPSESSRAPRGRSSARLILTNHPSSGPVFSGPHLEPWLCTTTDHGLGEPVDDACNAATVVEFFYQPEAGGNLQPYDPDAPADDVALTTTDTGETVPFVVRRERGTMNRSIYDIAVLYDPASDWEPWDPQSGWNGKVVWPFGPSSGTVHSQGSPQSVLNRARLGAGFMVATSSLNVHGSNLNTVVSAESMMMVKEHIVDTYGEIRYVIGQGGSGGAIQQQLVANSYPGLLDGIMPQASYPDTLTTGSEVTGCMAVNDALDQLDGWTTAQRTAVYGHETALTCTLFPSLFGSGTDPTVGCGLPADVIFDPETNPDGVRCTYQDYMVNVYGPDDETGFAAEPGSNIGVQYGYNALLDGTISPEQFVSLNETAGSVGSPDERQPSDRGATATAYRTGQVNDGAHLDRIPVVELRQNGNFEFHTNYHTWAMRDRMVATNGHHDNHVIFWSDRSIPGGVQQEAFELMDRWLEAIEADSTGDPQEELVARHRPDGVLDTCYIGGEPSTDYEWCLEQAPYYGSPGIAAGGRSAHDVIECQLTPPDPGAYGEVSFTDDQWDRLEAAFPDGVCDTSAPAVDQVESVPWLSFTDGPGGEPLGDPPTSEPGCPGRSGHPGRPGDAGRPCPRSR